MQSALRFDRKQFLCWSVAATSAAALGCSDEPDPGPSGGGGAGGTAGSSANAGTFSSGGAGSGGTFASGGSSGSGTAGAGGATSGAGGGGGSPAMPDCSTKLKTLITADHGHVFTVTMADVMAGVDKLYDTKGASDHPHWIKLSAADFSKLAAGGTVRKISCNDGHEHEFIVNCLGEGMPMTTGGVAGLCENQRACGETMTELCAELPVM